ncbi:SIR2 family protein [Mesoflavibacter zeaxanthinifaciens]|uniref:SIR2 family protein n=1 Tax=Mesoflavibacter zeaxanthinifaciens TaxID=393060 RepID=UPI003A93B892
MSEIYFYKGKEEVLSKTKNAGEDLNESDQIKKIQDAFSKVLDGKNLSFLLGCGCSSFVKEIDKVKTDVGVPTMMPLAKEFYTDILLPGDKLWLKATLKLDIEVDIFKRNLEKFLGTLHSIYFFYETTGQEKGAEAIKVAGIITQARNFLLKKCLNETNRTSKADKDLVELYKSFYRKLLYRNSNLPKPNIFTTNYDLYNEIALDKLGIHYVNGFSGGIQKYFNPTIFNYALAEKMDLSQSKWSVIDNFVYLYKIHGSLNWVQADEDSKLFRVREIQETSYDNLQKQEVIMIHPTPLKQNASMGSPYSDLFREFQKKLMQNNNVLIALGYSFNDEHINNLIYQAFTIPSFRLIVLGDNNASEEIAKLQSLDDPRIWIVGGELEDTNKLHYFKGFVEKILPDLSNDEIDHKIENAIRKLFKE